MAFVMLEKVLTTSNAERLSSTSYRCSQINIQAKPLNSSAVEFSPNSTLTSGAGLTVPAATLPIFEIRPLVPSGNVEDLYNWYVIGAIGDGVNILVEVY